MELTIKIQEDSKNAAKLVEQILKVLDKEPSFEITRKDDACTIPDKEETDPAKKTAEEQKYMLCRFQSIQKQLFDLQNDLVRDKKDITAASMVRDAMRDLKLAEEDYMLVSRRRLSMIVNKTAHNAEYAARKPHGSCD